ncbi:MULTISPECIES: YtpI family protein [Metabacillus]|uniref:YtpI family protein n=1 Tax=Metabacillus TaxID=2675233 RepID=UPI0004934A24|nr:MULTISPECIES: YtpI family protein [Metabacillus]KEZ51286.1 membrane protein [Metabacillus indicus LMG 22858]
MPVLVILIVFAFSFYLFYKVKFYRTRKPMEKQWLSAKSSIALGVFVFLFGLNQLFLFHSTVSLVVGIIFMVVGLASSLAGYKAYKHYLPHAAKEAREG